MSASHSAAAPMEVAPQPAPARNWLWLVWGQFWALMLVLSFSEHARRLPWWGWWQPLLWEGSACLVATAILAWHWRRLPRLDDRLHDFPAWLGLAVRAAPLWAVVFVVAVYGIRHAVYALVGQAYAHPPWPQVLPFEVLKFMLFYTLFAAALFGWRAHLAWQQTRWRAAQDEALMRQAQLAQLAQQMQPHFLFNALNTIAATVHADAGLADHLLTRLAGLLRAAMEASRRPDSTLQEEWALAQGYADIMQARFGARVHCHWQLAPDAAACVVPSLCLQPLLENAFRHGVEKTLEPVHIDVQASVQQGRLCLAVRNEGSALAPGWAAGIGIGNLRQRLVAAHGASAQLDLVSAAAGEGRAAGVCARMELPCAC